MNSAQVVTALAALAQESRLSIFRMLVQAGPGGMSASQISEGIGMAPSLLSFHLKELLQAGLLTQTRDGRSLIYATHFDTMNTLLAYLTENCCGGNPCTPANSVACSGDKSCV